MEMLPPPPVPPNVVVGATVVKRFPGYGEHRGTIAEIDLDGGKVVVRWATDERTTLSLGEAAKRAIYAVPPTEEEEDGDSTIAYESGDETVDYEGDGGALTTTSSRFWGVHWDRQNKKWQARYLDADGKRRTIGNFDDEEEAARAVNNAIRDAGLEGRRKTNAVDATGRLPFFALLWRVVRCWAVDGRLCCPFGAFAGRRRRELLVLLRARSTGGCAARRARFSASFQTSESVRVSRGARYH